MFPFGDEAPQPAIRRGSTADLPSSPPLPPPAEPAAAPATRDEGWPRPEMHVPHGHDRPSVIPPAAGAAGGGTRGGGEAGCPRASASDAEPGHGDAPVGGDGSGAGVALYAGTVRRGERDR